MMCSLKFGTKENKKPKKMTILEMVYDGYWIVLSCVWWSSKKKFHIYVFFSMYRIALRKRGRQQIQHDRDRSLPTSASFSILDY